MNRFIIFVLCLHLGFLARAELTEAQLVQLPPPASHPVDFKKDVKPILEASCIKCHARGKEKGGFKLDTRETALAGGDSGPAIIPGKSKDSLFIHLVSGLDEENIMPDKGSKLTREQVATLRAWIDQGVKWDPAVSFAKVPPQNLHADKSTQKITATRGNPIDQILAPYFKKHRIKAGKPVSDAAFARRVYLDIVGLIPTAEQTETFARNRSPKKREELVRQLLADNQGYAEHWLSFWNDLLRNDYRGAGFIDGGRKQISGWLYTALATNMPYDRFVAELVNPTPASEGFTKGIIWRGVVNASQTPQMQAAQNVSQVFMGVNLKCASCHDSFINDWTLADAYGLASIFAEAPLELVECDKPTGKTAIVRFLYPELGSIDGKLPRAERLKRLSEVMTARNNGRLTRTIANRLWGRFMGRALVEPVDDMESLAWNKELLDFLGEDLADHGYDLKHLIARILTSDTYSMAAVNLDEDTSKDFVFRGPGVRRMSAEQFVDSLGVLTGVWHKLPASDFDLQSGKTPEQLAAWMSPETHAKWIWNSPDAAKKVSAGTLYFRRSVVLPESVDEACIILQADDTSKLFINGREVPPNNDFPWFDKTSLTDITSFLKAGTNVFAVEVRNTGPSPAGLLCYARLRNGKNVFDFTSDAKWKAQGAPTAGWHQPTTDDTAWTPAVELGDFRIAPWNLEKKYGAAIATAHHYGKVRSALVPANPLMLAMGRPNREQLITVRANTATTLQALELTNGGTLADTIRRGATRLARDNQKQPAAFVESVYRNALGRKPNAGESRAAVELLGSSVTAEGVEDFLWGILMLPDYQLIY